MVLKPALSDATTDTASA